MTIWCISETEAKTKLCCDGTGGTTAWLFGSGKCAGSKCMAWRWVRTNINDKPGEPLYESDNTHGYCGLAGPPWSGK